MARRRLYVFGGIILLGILIGVFCLPGAEETGMTGVPDDGEPIARVEPTDSSGVLPINDFGNQPGDRAKRLVREARSTADAAERLAKLTEAHRLNRTGRWGGEAAAEIGYLLKAAGKATEAKEYFLLARQAPVSPETLARVNAELAIPTTATDPVALPTAGKIKTVEYKVQSGDSLWKISRLYATSAEAIQKINRLTTDVLQIGQRLKVPQGPFDVLVTKSQHTLQLLQAGQVIKVYAIGLGRDNGTPAGSFTVSSKLVDPVWYNNGTRIPPNDPRNALGSRWIGFNGRIGIHGIRKAEENTIGKDMSDGCVRMRDLEVQDLYDYLVEGKSKVTIVE